MFFTQCLAGIAMPIPFTCPHCGEETLAEDRYAGLEGPCVNCGRVVTVPADAPRVTVTEQRDGDGGGNRDRVKHAIVGLAAVALVLAMAAVIWFTAGPAIEVARLTARRNRCANNMQQLGVALLAYERDHGSFPPAYVIGPDGRRWHSWRVLILPYLGTDELDIYGRYDMNQPWDSPHNIQLIARVPDVFVSPADTTSAIQQDTSYLAVVGPGMIFRGAGTTTAEQVLDEVASTILLVETAGSGVGWTEPRDLDARALSYSIGTDLGGNHPGGMLVLSADGETHFLPSSVSPTELHALLTAAGGEDVEFAD